MASANSTPLITSTEQSISLIPSSVPSSTSPLSTMPTPANDGNVAQVPQHSTALVPAAATASTSAQPPQTSMPQNPQEDEEAWSLVTRSLMVAVMACQPPATAASTLLRVFQPMVDGWATARRESKRWKERTEMYMAEHHKHRTELAQKHDMLQAHAERLQQSLAESQSKVGELESEKSTLVAKVSSLEKALGSLEAQARAAQEGHAHEKQQTKSQMEAAAKSVQEAKMMYEKLSQDTEKRTRSHNAEISQMQHKLKEMEAIKAKLEEQLGSAIANAKSFEGELAQKRQDVTTLQTRVAELNSRKEAVERQLALYQRIPTRRF